MFNLIFVVTHTLLGTYTSIDSCQFAIRQIIANKINPYNNPAPEIQTAINLQMKFQTEYICIPTNTNK